MRKPLASPLLLPIATFLGAILLGGTLLALPVSSQGPAVSFLDGCFTATSAVCVTGLTVVDTGTTFSRFGQTVILLLIQAGGLGIMTFASLAMYLWKRRISLVDRIAVGQSLLHDPGFHLGRFLLGMFAGVFLLEGLGAVLLHLCDPGWFDAYNAAFHAVSAFCNAGFGLHAKNLAPWQGNVGVNVVVMALIILGGLGFSVINELAEGLPSGWRRGPGRDRFRPSFHTRVVLRVTGWLILIGAAGIFFLEFITLAEAEAGMSLGQRALTALFQSVTCRTAGFNTVSIVDMSSVTLLFLCLLMFIGGSPGSTAGGIKTTTFRTMAAFLASQLRRRPQTVIGSRALDADTVHKAVTLTFVSVLTLLVAVLLLSITEARGPEEGATHAEFLPLLFEAFSAFGTVGLSADVTPTLSDAGKVIVMALMFTGRLGPILFLATLQLWQRQPRHGWAEEQIMIG